MCENKVGGGGGGGGPCLQMVPQMNDSCCRQSWRVCCVESEIGGEGESRHPDRNSIEGRDRSAEEAHSNDVSDVGRNR